MSALPLNIDDSASNRHPAVPTTTPAPVTHLDSPPGPDLINALPDEILLMIFNQVFTRDQTRKSSTALRLVCQKWNAFTTSHVCNTIKLNFEDILYLCYHDSLLTWEDLGRIQSLCHYMHVDMRLLRYEGEIEAFSYAWEHAKDSRGCDISDALRYFFEADADEVNSWVEQGPHQESALSSKLFRAVLDRIFSQHQLALRRFRLDLPQPTRRFTKFEDCFSATAVFANTMSCLANRIRSYRSESNVSSAPSRELLGDVLHIHADIDVEQDVHSDDEDSVLLNDKSLIKLETLVISNLFELTLRRICNNPVDMKNIRTVMRHLKNLDIEFVLRHEPGPSHEALWKIIKFAPKLTTLRLSLLFQDRYDHRSLVDIDSLQIYNSLTLPNPPSFGLENLTSLELAKVNLMPQFFVAAAVSFGATLKELYLELVTLYVVDEESLVDRTVLSYGNVPVVKYMWVGCPNIRPKEDYVWIAIFIRENFPQLEHCEAMGLEYDHYNPLGIVDGFSPRAECLVLLDKDIGRETCRTLGQVFSEVVENIEQPLVWRRGTYMFPDLFLPYSPDKDGYFFSSTKPRPKSERAPSQGYDHPSHFHTGSITPSYWRFESLDGTFPVTKGGSTYEKLLKIMYVMNVLLV
ncbi:hypothetical protein BROUX41_000866 [Berkeleyomyces rouxiae]|uniref:uncharacterized protein n=1 Tax=Berkeleyomyces rouxiae TaxID=2035830 RepID=UPI003B808D4E